MREYTHTMAIEELQKLIAKGIAKPDEVERWTADPPTLPSWKVVELELSDVPEFIQGHGSIRFNELELQSPLDNYTTQAGERIDFRIPIEVVQEINRQIKAQHKADYFAKVEQEFTKLKNDLLSKLQDSPDPERGRLNVVERWERILEGRDTDGLQRTEINLRTAWADITEGIRYIGGQKHRDRRKAMQMAAPPHLANYRNLVWHERQVDNQLRVIYINAEASHRFLQWLRDIPAEQPQPVQPITNPRLLAVVSDNGFQEYHDETHKYFEQWQPLLPASTSHEYRFELDAEAYKKTYFDTPHLHDATFDEGVLLRRLINNLKTAKHPAHVSYRDYLKGLLKATDSPEQVAKPTHEGSTGAESEPKRGLTFKVSKTERNELFSELVKYAEDGTLLLRLLEGEHAGTRVKVKCKQNEFVEVFKRLQYNGKITQPVPEIVGWLAFNFLQPKGKPFAQRTIEDLFKLGGKPPKSRLCDFDWLTFKDAKTLQKEAHKAKMNAE
jgi:hypothetical protein